MTPQQQHMINRLKVAVWMVGNIDTEEDKKAWWARFEDLWKEVSQDPYLEDLVRQHQESNR